MLLTCSEKDNTAQLTNKEYIFHTSKMKDKSQTNFTQSPVINNDLAQFGDSSDTDSTTKYQNMQQFN